MRRLAGSEAQQRERGAHRGRLAVVALVDHRGGAAVRRRHPLLRAAALHGLHIARGDAPPRRDRPQAPPPPPGRRARCGRGARRARRGGTRRRGRRCRPKRCCPRRRQRRAVTRASPPSPKVSTRAPRRSPRSRHVQMRRVGRQHRRRRPAPALGDGRLLVRDRVQAAEMADMRRADRRDHRHMRPREARERRDLARVVHADLDHGEGGAARAARQGQRHAPVVVVGRDGGMGLAERAEQQPQHLLGAGLADAAGDGDHAPGEARPSRRAERRQAAPGCPPRAAAARRRERRAGRGRPWRRRRRGRGHRRRSRGRRAASRSATNRSPGATLRESMETPVTADLGGERAAGRARAARPRSRGRRSCARPRPPRAPPPRRRRDASRRRSSARSHAPCRPPPARRPGAGPRPRAAMAPARSPASTPPGQPASTAARIAAGSSLRGLSSVTQARVGQARAGGAHQRPLAGVAVAAGAEQHVQPRARRDVRAKRGEQPLQRVRRVGVVDIDGGAVRQPRRQLHPPAHAGQARQQRESALRRHPARDGQRQRRAARCRPGSGRAGTGAARGGRRTPRPPAPARPAAALGGAGAPRRPPRPPSAAAGRALPATSRSAPSVSASMSALADKRGAGRQQRVEQAQLGGAVGRHVAVVVEMVARQVGEARGGDPQTVQPALLDAVRGSLDRRLPHAGAGQARRAMRAAPPGRAW